MIEAAVFIIQSFAAALGVLLNVPVALGEGTIKIYDIVIFLFLIFMFIKFLGVVLHRKEKA